LKRILVVAAHPDDEVLGCGGAMAAHAAAGDTVSVLIMAEGITSRAAQRDADGSAGEVSALRAAARRANEVLGVRDVSFCDFPDNRLDSVDLIDLVKAVEQAVTATTPDIVYTHFAGDLNVDHQRVSEAVVTACRPLPGAPVAKLLMFEVASSTEWQVAAGHRAFAPNYFVDIADTLDRKCTALECYASEMREWPHARSVIALTHLAFWRGANVGLPAAEAFMVGRIIETWQGPGRA
jgi:LmbE family N-acetylglucosaminyl deacetylase